ncbi:TlpA disulfide reductase family protein [Accumulibacter sp.]|jgi:cytochrome c biogenesis protein CcmG/thiol:disulfide interchange protein DsbE|uniref:TlpA disulfide reductase family protein n=1 Tax=Accumulibacter sp. TaxID=2053492 RepID=UPI00262D4B5B|nr:TlpA disulfide reductase family protein [Accumulibacter sp.]
MLRKPLALLSFLAALALTACDEGNTNRLNTGDIAPAFAASSLGAVPFRFPDDLRGKPVVIRFWADWCRFCEGEMKAIERVWQRHKDQGLMVIAVNAGQNRQDVAAFISKIGVTYPALLDEKAAISRQYGVVALPTTYFVGADGRIRGKVLGEADEATFERLTVDLLK